MKIEAETGMMWPEPKDTWSHQDMLSRRRQKYKISQDLSVGLACYLTVSLFHWSNKMSQGKDHGTGSGERNQEQVCNPPQCPPVPAGLK